MPLRLLMSYFLLCLLAACSKGGETALSGAVLFQDRPVAGASIEVYLKGEKDRATLPFASTGADAAGQWRIALPPGRYFVIAKKKSEGEGGGTRMLMAECPANPIELTAGERQIPPFNLREMGRDGALVAEPETGVSGRLIANGQPLAGAFVYVYSEDAAGLMGPSYGEAARSAVDGTFRINLPAGRFYLAARKRADGSRSGEVATGDLNASYPGNPVMVERGSYRQLGDFPLKQVEEKAHRARREQGTFTATGTALAGRIVDQDGKPVAGVYAFAYLDSRMVGKPTYISPPSGTDGRFEIRLGDGGSYYVGVRSTFGGPLEPGEWVGTYDGRADHRAEAIKGQQVELSPIVVREVW
ncbi:MAG: hypothetical protein A2091_12595 [Desulfuromonadales bacterium GWD2_61_12]|nr:MAG: hypothetical protein A2005_11320 [Desulfuromonadales bacterium GWC2_61_20]OGR36522.1 MAG: hypothetical protein A2091_12595 [Desulfuromonadales bacterium GWD2_61_12]HAD05086.1 hypothetical protein [Desulfuromonas sp.]